MKNILIAEFKHETNRFCPIPADVKAYKARNMLFGDDTFSYYRGIQAEIGGFLDILEKEDNLNLVPVAAFNAVPSGPVTAEVYEIFTDTLMNAIEKTEKIDGVLLCLHGAIVVETSEDGEGDLLEMIRIKLGADVPIIATLDLHANVTAKMIHNANAFLPYRKYPHTDTFECGQRAARLMLKTLRGQCLPVVCCTKLPIMLPVIFTALPVLQDFNAKAQEWEKRPSILDVSLCHGFYFSDIEELGTTVTVVADKDTELAQSAADFLSDELWRRRSELTLDAVDVDGAFDLFHASVKGEGPVVFADISDNPGGGGSGDTTHILRKLLECGVKNAAIAVISDPCFVAEAVAAGVGEYVELNLGGKGDSAISGGLLKVRAYVKGITDGNYFNKDIMRQGLKIEMGRTVIVQVDGIEIIVISSRVQPYDREAFRSCGITPEDKELLVVKSAVHFRQSFDKIASRIVNVLAPGMVSPTPELLIFKHCTKAMYPLNRLASC